MATKKDALDWDAELAAVAEESQPFTIGGETYTPKPVDDVPAATLYAAGSDNIEALASLLVDESAERLLANPPSHRRVLFAYRKLYALHATLPTMPSDD